MLKESYVKLKTLFNLKTIFKIIKRINLLHNYTLLYLCENINLICFMKKKSKMKRFS